MKTTVNKDFGVVSTSVKEIKNEEIWNLKQKIIIALQTCQQPPVQVLCATICKALNIDLEEISNKLKNTKEIDAGDPFGLLDVSSTAPSVLAKLSED